MLTKRAFLLIALITCPSIVFGEDVNVSSLVSNIQNAKSIKEAGTELNKAKTSLDGSDKYAKLEATSKTSATEKITAAIDAAKNGITEESTPQDSNQDSESAASASKDTRTDEEKAQALAEKQQAYDDAKATEQSTANKTLTALTTAATGIGAMELAQGLSEQTADKNAENSMAAYIQTMRCTYANGKQVKAGPDEIELPGGNNENLMKYRTEYLALVADLKERKTALGMKAGIESEEILDKAQMGLYDDENVGIDSGAYASLYRAQMFGSEADLAKIAEEQKTSKNRVIGGAVAAGVGVVGGILGNSLINGKLGEKIKEAKAKKDATKTENDALSKLQSCLKDGGAKNTNLLKFSKFTPSILHLENINCSGAEWSNKVKDKTASSLFIDSDDAETITKNLVSKFGDDIAYKLLDVTPESFNTSSQGGGIEQTETQVTAANTIDMNLDIESEQDCKEIAKKTSGTECYQEVSGKWKVRWTVRAGDPCPTAECFDTTHTETCKYVWVPSSFVCVANTCKPGYKVFGHACKIATDQESLPYKISNPNTDIYGEYYSYKDYADVHLYDSYARLNLVPDEMIDSEAPAGSYSIIFSNNDAYTFDTKCSKEQTVDATTENDLTAGSDCFCQIKDGSYIKHPYIPSPILAPETKCARLCPLKCGELIYNVKTDQLNDTEAKAKQWDKQINPE